MLKLIFFFLNLCYHYHLSSWTRPEWQEKKINFRYLIETLILKTSNVFNFFLVSNNKIQIPKTKFTICSYVMLILFYFTSCTPYFASCTPQKTWMDTNILTGTDFFPSSSTVNKHSFATVNTLSPYFRMDILKEYYLSRLIILEYKSCILK